MPAMLYASIGGGTPTLQHRMGTGGNQVPVILKEIVCVVPEMTPKVDTEGVAFNLTQRMSKDPP